MSTRPLKGGIAAALGTAFLLVIGTTPQNSTVWLAVGIIAVIVGIAVFTYEAGREAP